MSNFDDLLSNAPAEGQGGKQFSKGEYAAKKLAERENLYALSDATALEVAGDGGMFQKYLDVQAQFSRYSAVNALLILAQKPNATRLGDFERWKELGGFVKPQQTGISILERHDYPRDDGSSGYGYNVKKVFDISQVDARKITPAPAPNYDNRQLLKAIVHNAPMEITSVESLPGDLCTSADFVEGKILVRKGMEFADIFRGLARELSAAHLREYPEIRANAGVAAYCASYILCKKYGVDVRQFSFDEAPAAFEGFDAKEIKSGLAQIRDAADAISGRMSKQLDAVQKAAKAQDAR
jgi:hypothetical protein